MNPIDELDALQAKLGPAQQPGVTDPYAFDSSFTKGLRSGGLAAGAQLNSLAGAVGESLGADNFAKGRYSRARSLRDESAATAPPISQWADVHSPGDFGSYAAGLVGSSLPVALPALGASAMTGGAAIPAMLAGGAVMAPFSMGDVVQRQQDAGQQVNLGQAALLGGADAALNSIVPGMAGARLAGGLGAAAKQTLRHAIGHEALQLPLQSATGTAGDVVKHLGVTGEMPSNDQMLDTAMGNAVGGLPFAGAGLAGRIGHGGVGGVAEGLAGARDSVTGALGKARDRAGAALGSAQEAGGVALGQAGEALGGAADRVGAAAPRTADGGIDLSTLKDSVAEVADRVAKGLPLQEHVAAIKAASESDLPGAVAGEAKARLEQVKTWATELANDAGLTPEKRQELTEYADKIGDEASVRGIAALKAAQETGKGVLGAIGKLYDSTRSKVQAGLAEREGTKKSLVYAREEGDDSGPQGKVADAMRRAISDVIVPALQERHPALMSNPDAINKLADSLRITAEGLAKDGNVPQQYQEHLRAVFGDDYTSVLGELHGIVAGNEKSSARFFGGLNRLADNENAGHGRMQVLREAMADGEGHARSDRYVRALDEQVGKFVGAGFTRGLGKEQAQFRIRDARAKLRKIFGDKTDDVLEAYAPRVREVNDLQRAGHTKESDSTGGDGFDFNDSLEESPVNISTVSRAPVMSPGNAMRPKEQGGYGEAPGQTLAERQIAKAQEQRGVRARWVPAAEHEALTGKSSEGVPEGHGFVVAEHLPAGDALSTRELAGMKWDKQKQSRDADKNDTLIDTGVHKFDALKITKIMLATMPGDERPQRVRAADAFLQGVAKLQDHFGDVFDVPDSTVLVKNGKHSLTYGEAKRMNLSGESKGSGAEPEVRTREEVRADIDKMKAAVRGAVADRASPEHIEKLKERGGRLERELGGLEVRDDRERAGKTGDAKSEESDIHEAAAILTPDELRHTVNMDGTSVQHGGRSEPMQYEAQAAIAAAHKRMDAARQQMAKTESGLERAKLRAEIADASENIQKQTAASGQITPAGLRALDGLVAAAKTRLADTAAARDTGSTKVVTQSAVERNARTKMLETAEQHIAALKTDHGALDPLQTRNLLAALHPDQKLSDAMELMDTLPAAKPAAKPAPAAPARDVINSKPKLDTMLAKEDYSALDTRAKVDEFLKRAEARHKELSAERERLYAKDEDLPATQMKALAKLDDIFRSDSTFDRESLYDGVDDVKEGAPAERVMLPNTSPYTAKDQAKSDQASKFIGRGSSVSSTNAYAKAWGDRANTGVYHASDKVFVSAEGSRGSRKSPDLQELGKATAAGATLITDNPSHRGRSFNVGEREVAKFLSAQGYVEDGNGVWTPGSTPDPKALAAKKAAFLERARSGDKALVEELRSSTDIKGMQRAVDAMGADAHPSVIDAINERMSELMKNPDNAYAAELNSKYSAQATDPNGTTTNEQREAVRKDVLATLGPRVKTVFANMLHAGEFEPSKHVGADDIIRVSVHSLNPLGAGFHEALHGLFAKLTRAGGEDANGVMNTLHTAADGALVKNQLRRLLKDEPDALRQLDDGEERVAYMYQFWRENRLELGGKATTIFGRITQALRQVLGLWSNDERALHIMEAFRAGDFARAEQGLGKALRVSDEVRGHALGNLYAKHIEAWVSRYAPGMKLHLEAMSTDAGSRHVGVLSTDQTGKQTIGLNLAKLDKMAPDELAAVAAHEFGHALWDHLERTLPKEKIEAVRAAWREAKADTENDGYSFHDFLETWASPIDAETYFKNPAAFKEISSKDHEWKNYVLSFDEFAAEQIARAIASDPSHWSNAHLKRIFELHSGMLKSGGKAVDSINEALTLSSKSATEVRSKGINAVARALMAQGHSAALDRAGEFTKPLMHMAENIAVAGSAKLRETGVPALRDIANGMKRSLQDSGEDQGFVPASRIERTQRMNELATAMNNYTPEQMNEALISLRGGAKATSMEARVIARVTKNFLAKQLTYLRDAGVDIGDRGKDYFPRVYDPSKLVDQRKAFEAVLDKYGYDGAKIAEKIIRNSDAEFSIETDRPGMQAARELKLDRIPDGELLPFMKDGYMDVMNGYVYQATRRAEWSRRWGDKNELLEAKFSEARAQGATKEQLEAAQKFVRGVGGTLGDDINPATRKIFGTMIAYQNIRLLPLSIFSSIVDPAGIVVRGGTLGDAWHAFKRGIAEAIPAARGTLKNDHWAVMSEAMGTVDSAVLQHTMGELYGQGMMGDTTKKVNDAFFRFNLMEGFNRSMRVAATRAAAGFIERHADLKASEHSARWIAELGLNPGDIVKDAQGQLKMTEADGLTPEQATKIRAAINKWVDGAVLRPDAADKPTWMNDPHWALISHLKQFTYSFHETILKRVMHEHMHGNYRPAMALASYVPIMIAADLIKAAIQPGDPDWDKDLPSMIEHGTERSGLFGTGQFAVDLNHGVGGLTGPAIEQMLEAVDVVGGRKSFQSFALRSLPANSLYVGGGAESRVAE